MKCLKKYKWVKLPRHLIPNAKGIMGAFLRLASRAAFRKGYNYYCFVPMDSFGTRLLRILTVPDCSERLLGALFCHEERSYERGSFTYDAYVDGEYVLSFLDSNFFIIHSIPGNRQVFYHGNVCDKKTFVYNRESCLTKPIIFVAN